MRDTRETGSDASSACAQGEAPRERPAGDKVPILRAASLLGAAGIVHIEHAGEIYTLRRTRNDRLLLTK